MSVQKKLADLFENPPGASRILPMEGIRGFAVLLVFFVHYYALFGRFAFEGSLTARLWKFLSEIGHSGVDLFFVLSGFLIYGAVISRETPYLKFMVRRIQRIYPPFLAVFAFYLVLSRVFPGESKIPDGLVPATVYLFENLLLLPGLFEIVPMITVAWSLSYEIFYYLMIPALVAGLGLRRLTPRDRARIFFAFAGAYVAYCTLDFHPRLQLIMFVSGILLYELLGSKPKQAKTSVNRDSAGAAAFLVCLPFATVEHGWFIKIVVEFFAYFGFLYACFTSSSFLGRIFSWKYLRYLGNMSYSYYLLHGLALKFVALVAGRVFQGQSEVVFWCLLPVGFAATLVSSSFLFTWVEKPFSLPAVRRAPAARVA